MIINVKVTYPEIKGEVTLAAECSLMVESIEDATAQGGDFVRLVKAIFDGAAAVDW